MKKPLIALATIGLLALTGCSGSDDEKRADVKETQKISVAKKEISTKEIKNGVSYMEFTNTNKDNVSTLWFQLEGEPTAGSVHITRCSQDWTSEGKCEAEEGEQIVLPNVDLAGWKLPLASGATNLGPDATANLKFDVKDSDKPVSFVVSVEQPKEKSN